MNGKIIHFFIFLGLLFTFSGFNKAENIAVKEVVSFEKEVLPIIQQTCAIETCHIGGQTPPNLTKYNRIRAWAQRIKLRVTLPRAPMPPKDSKVRLTQDQIDKIVTWIDQGANNN
ncbi:MAG: c-type cytochrome [Candidatus Cyclobacteriaceae bacterium M3_2C_046]